MLTAAPLPTWSSLLRAVARPHSASDIAAPWRGPGDAAGWLSRSAWSLALIALWRKRQTQAASVTVWVPDLFCNASLVALRATGVDLVFYPVTGELTPDFAAFDSLAAAKPPDLFMLVHFFGLPSSAAVAREFCSRNRSWLIEDAAHVLRRSAGVGEHGDFVLYSPHKHLPIPDGAVLIARANGPAQLGAAGIAALGPTNSWPAQLLGLQRQLGCSRNRSRLRTGSWLVKRLLQKLTRRQWQRKHPPFAEILPAQPAQAGPLGLPAPSRLGQRLLREVVPEMETVAQRRKDNQRLWDAMLCRPEVLQGQRVAPAARPEDVDWTPYLAAYRVDSAAAQAITEALQRQGLPVTTWPDLPPEVSSNTQHHANAWAQRHSRLYLSVHQTLRIPQANRRGKQQ